MSRTQRVATLVVVSPHLDDAVLSLGAYIAQASRSGRRVVVLTVFAGNPNSGLRAGGWDNRGGFATEGEASTTRRQEDLEACSLLGAESHWLPLSEADYRDGFDWERSEELVSDALAEVGPDEVVVPGFPLTNPDHLWLTTVILGSWSGPTALYAEQPYRYWIRRDRPRPEAPPLGDEGRRTAGEWVRLHATLSEMRRKRRAILAYRSQMKLLGLGRRRNSKLNRMLLHERLRGGEAIARVVSE
jgi:LmbE family N-acetylglucosaminyl deacetylase